MWKTGAHVLYCTRFPYYGKQVHMFHGQTLKASNSETRAATANLRPDLECSFQAL